MRHLISGSKLGRQPAHRRAELRNLVTNLIEKERIQTTLRRAKAARPLAERMITLGKRDSLHARRQAAAFLMTPDATKKLFSDLAPRFADRPGRLHAHRSHRLAHRRWRRTRHPRIHRLGVEEEGKEAAEERQPRKSRKRRKEAAAKK